MILSRKQAIKSRLRFILSFIEFRKFLSKHKISNNYSNKNTYIFIIAPWLMTPAPWFAITTSLLLYRRGHKIQFLIDDLRFDSKTAHILQLTLIKWILISLKRLGMNMEYLSSYAGSNEISSEEIDIIGKLAFANAIHKNRGEEKSEAFEALCQHNFIFLKQNFPFVRSFIKKNIGKTYFLSGGIYANSGLFERLLKINDRSYFTFDCGFEVLLSTYKGVSAQFTDIPKSLELLLSQDNKEISFAKKSAMEEFEKRKNGTNKLNSQYQSFEDSETFKEVGILIPLNSPWDSAALNIASVFSGYNEWLLETIGIILENSISNITIRQHPDERYSWGRTKTDFHELIKERYSSERIQFVSCYDKVNSYALLDKADAVICYSSTFGIEAAMANKAVCVCSNVYYSELGFSYKPSNVDDIKFFLKNTLAGKIQIEQDKAYLTYYLGQQCNWLFTPFTPMMSDFEKWLVLGLDNLQNDPLVIIYLESLEELLPMSYIYHKKNYNNEI